MLSYCCIFVRLFRDGKGDRNDEPVIYEPGPYDVLVYEDIVYASGLAHSKSTQNHLCCYVYCHGIELYRQPVLIFIHGGGFTGGVKHKPEIIQMGKYYASRGVTFQSIQKS